MITKPLRALLFWLAAMVLGSVVATLVKMYPSMPFIFAMYIYFLVLDTGLIFLYLRTLRNREIAWIREGTVVGALWIILTITETYLLDVLVLGFEWRILIDSWPSYIILVVAGIVAGFIAEARYSGAEIINASRKEAD